MSKELINVLRHRERTTSEMMDAAIFGKSADLIEQQAERIAALEFDKATLLSMIETVMAIPNMSDAQLQELIVACQAVKSRAAANT